ncbi:MAG: hypothetical protein AB1742_13330, partial [bacterium]
MLAPDVRIVDIDPEHVERAFSLISPRMPSKPSVLVVFYEGNRVVHAVHSRRGPVAGVHFPGVSRLEQVADAQGADVVVCLEKNALPGFVTDVQSKVAWDEPYLFQALTVLECLRSELGRNIHFYSRSPIKMPAVSRRAASFFVRLLPARTLLMLVVFNAEEEEVWSSLV